MGKGLWLSVEEMKNLYHILKINTFKVAHYLVDLNLNTSVFMPEQLTR